MADAVKSENTTGVNKVCVAHHLSSLEPLTVQL